MSRLKPRNPPERSHGTRRECFDYSETHLSANGSGKTAPKLASLPKRPRRRLTSRRASPGKAGPRSGRPASKAAAAGEGNGDQARLASPSALSTSIDAMIRRAGQGEEGAKQTETCTGKPFTSFASFAKGGLAGAMYSFKCNTHPAISPSHAKKPPQRHHDARRPH